MLTQTKLFKKDIAGALMDCRFDPKEPGPQNVIARSATPEYCKSRAAEILFGAPTNAEDFKQAIQILTMGYILAKQGEDDVSNHSPSEEN